MASHTNRTHPFRAVRDIQLPVLFQFPDEEPDHARSQQHDRTGDGERRGLGHASHANGVMDQRLQVECVGQQDLVRDRHHREVLNRIDLRLDQQRDHKADHIRHDRPDRPNDDLQQHKPSRVA